MLRRTAGEVDAFFVVQSILARLLPAALSEKEILLHLDDIAKTKSDSTRARAGCNLLQRAIHGFEDDLHQR